MTTAGSLLKTKGQHVWSIDPDATVYEAIERMAEKGIGALVVVKDEKLVGIFSERDYARKIILLDRSSRTTKVREIMTERVVYVRPETSVEDCMAIMTDKKIRHLPVLERDSIVGVLSLGDLVKSIIAGREQLIQHLESYITGR